MCSRSGRTRVAARGHDQRSAWRDTASRTAWGGHKAMKSRASDEAEGDRAEWSVIDMEQVAGGCGHRPRERSGQHDVARLQPLAVPREPGGQPCDAVGRMI